MVDPTHEAAAGDPADQRCAGEERVVADPSDEAGAGGPADQGCAGEERVVADPSDETGAGVVDATAVARGVHAAALASLPRAGSRRLHRLLAGRDPAEVWEQVRYGAVPGSVADSELRAAWRAHSARVDLAAVAGALTELDAWATTPCHDDYPKRLLDDIDPAPVLFRRGRRLDADTPSVAIVGTRRCTPTGRSVAVELGSGLAAAGVTVVSGLALGIDGAAHRGALSDGGAPVAGVVGSGLDVVYPRGNSDLWQAVGEAGTLLSEAPLGAEPEGWRFPARNRLLAGLADVVVVVESKRAGGSMHTVEEALRRGVGVMAVPGSVRNPAAAGTNLLLSEGCAPACCTEDVLVALGLATEGRSGRTPADDGQLGGGRTGETAPNAGRPQPLPSLDPVQQSVLDALDDGPVSLDRLVIGVDAPAPAVLVAADQLEGLRLLARDGGRVMRA